MSYLDNGATHRSLFRLMPPLHHDVDPNRSQVLAYIMQNLGGDVGRAIRAFNSMRHPKSKVVVFDQVHRMWKGCDWLPSDEESKDAMILVEHRALERRVVAMDGELRKALKEIKRLNKQMADLYTDIDADGKEEREVVAKPPAKQTNSIQNLVAQAWS
jgi:hypothetical protein